MHSIETLLDHCRLNRSELERRFAEIDVEHDMLAALEKLAATASIAVSRQGGYYSSPSIEMKGQLISRSLPLQSPTSQYRDHHILHVATQLYRTGGHTRVLERWIEATTPDYKHSLFVTEPCSDLPERLIAGVKASFGSIFRAHAGHSILDKVLRLRNVASHFQLVVLHIHMDDIIPLVAFGAGFARPILFYNHADHRFSVGMSVAGIVAETRRWGVRLSLNRRAVSWTRLLGIPLDEQLRTSNTRDSEIRQKFGLPMKSDLILTVASSQKYTPLLELDYFRFAIDLLRCSTDLVFVIVGLSGDRVKEISLLSEFKSNFRFISEVSKEDLSELATICNLGLDSFPEGGCTTAIDLISLGLPFLSVDCPTSQMDFVIDCDGHFRNTEELKAAVISLLSNDEMRSRLICTQRKSLISSCSSSSFRQRFLEIVDDLGSRISPKAITYVPSHEYNDLDLLHTCQSLSAACNA